MLKLGIIGQPRSGKTTIYNAVAAANADVNAYMAPDEIRRTVVKVPDERLDRLNDLFKPNHGRGLWLLISAWLKAPFPSEKTMDCPL